MLGQAVMSSKWGWGGHPTRTGARVPTYWFFPPTLPGHEEIFLAALAGRISAGFQFSIRIVPHTDVCLRY